MSDLDKHPTFKVILLLSYIVTGLRQALLKYIFSCIGLLPICVLLIMLYGGRTKNFPYFHTTPTWNIPTYSTFCSFNPVYTLMATNLFLLFNTLGGFSRYSIALAASKGPFWNADNKFNYLYMNGFVS